MDNMEVHKPNVISQTPLDIKRVVVSDKLSGSTDSKHSFRHAPCFEYPSQVVAEHHVTRQQIVNAISTLIHTSNKTSDLEREPRFAAGKKSNYDIDISDTRLDDSPDWCWCKVCKAKCSYVTYFILKRLPDSSRNDTDDRWYATPLEFTEIELHHMTKHGSVPNQDRFVAYLDLKPNTCYAPIFKSVLDWRFISNHPVRGPLRPFSATKQLICIHEKDNVHALVFDTLPYRSLFLDVATPGLWDIVVEGIHVSLFTDFNRRVNKYYLGWKQVLVAQDWFCV